MSYKKSCADDYATLKLPDPNLVLFFENIDKRQIWVDMDIDDVLIDFGKYIMRWNAEDIGIIKENRKPILMFIYSYGGIVDAANALINIMKISKTPVYTINVGQCCSAAALLFLAGHKKYMMPNSQILIHQGSVGLQGSTNSVIEQVDNIKKMECEIKQYILDNSKIDSKLYKKNEKKEWFLSPKEALELGVCDIVIDDMDEILR